MSGQNPYNVWLEATGSIVPLIIIDGQRNVVLASDKFEEMTGYNIESLQSTKLDQVLVLATCTWEELVSRCQHDGQKTTLSVSLNKKENGSKLHLKMTAMPVELAPSSYCVLTFELEHEIQSSDSYESELLRAINRNLKEGLYRSQKSGEIVYANEALVKMFGFDSVGEMMKVSSSEFYVEPAKRIELQSKMEFEGFVTNLEVLFKRKDGSVFWGLLSTSKTIDDNGTILYDGALRDISSLKEIERQLKIEKQKAEQASIAKELFLSTMSHELRTPMNAVIGMTHLLLADDPKAEQVENLKTLKFSAENLLHIINDILDFSKIEAGKIELENENFAIRNLVKNTVEVFKVKAQNKSISLILSIDERCPDNVLGDSTRLAQILNNLISNAIKFTYHGEVNVDLVVKEKNDEHCILAFSVKDTGIGIPQNKLAAIFSLFTQASSSTTRKFGGTGLGLTITKSLLKLYGANLEVESQPGFGSDFHFDLNLATTNALETPNPHFDLLTARLVGKRILITEDNEVNQLLIQKFLTIWGAESETVSNGAEAVSMVKKEKFDLILMDLQMPVMDGYMASSIIREIPGCSKDELPIIAVTASALLEVRRRVLEAGMNDYVSKPFSPEQLYERISLYLLPPES
ncbi:MAG: PAS domain S-box-containing protein [Flavobacteriales bacterium]|jgi:PAS domain S-box-containing protein